MFSIGFSEEPLEYPYDATGVPAAPGRLVLEKSIEEFLANLHLWSKSDYESHWKRELKTLLKGNPKVALVVSFNDPHPASNMEIWRVYRSGKWAYFQNQLLAFDSLPDDFDVLEISRHIQDRAMTTADGDRISEWRVALTDIELFLRAGGPVNLSGSGSAKND